MNSESVKRMGGHTKIEEEFMRYKVKLAEFHVVEVEAENKQEAEDKVAVMDDEDILKESIENTGMVIWQTTGL